MRDKQNSRLIKGSILQPAKILLIVVITAVGIVVMGCTAALETRVLTNFLQERLSSEYVVEHFEITSTYKSQVFFNLRYGNHLTNTKVSSANFSGFARIINAKVVEYYGPLKKYELKIQKEEAEVIFKVNNCTGDITLEVGDFIQSGKEELNGLYWKDGTPVEGRLEDSCIIDAESGVFRIEKGKINMLIPGDRT